MTARTRRVMCSRNLRSRQLRFDGLLHRVEVVPFGNFGAVDEDRRRAVDPLRLGFRDRRLDARSLLATIETLVERPRIEPQCFGHLLEASVAKTVWADLMQE